MKKALSLLLAASLLVPILSGCSRKIDNSGYVPTGDAILMEGQDPESLLPEEENTQELALAYYPTRSLDPLFGSDYTNRVLMSLMYQGLFAVDNQKNPTPILCSGYRVSANRQTWTIYLDPGATFSDGSSVTAGDVVASYQQARENDYYKNRFFHFSSIEATDDGGIVFYMDTPYENLPLLLDIPIVKAEDIGTDHPRGSGPYVFVETASGARLQRVDSWWCGDAKIPATDESIALVEVSSIADVRDEFQFGDVSVVCTNPMSDSFVEYRCDYELWEIESGYMMYIGCNIFYSDFFEDGTLRKFLTYGIDRASLARDAYNGLVDTVTLPCSPRAPYYSTTLASRYQYDSMTFLDNVVSYRFPTNDKGVPKELRLLVNSSDSARVRIARSIAENLTDLGLACNTFEYSTTTFRNAIAAANYDIYLGVTRLSPNMDLTEFFRNWGEMSYGSLAHETLYSMCKNALQDSGNYYNLYKTLADDGRIIPVMFGYYAVYAQRGLMPDLNPSRDNVFYYALEKTMDDILLEEPAGEA